MSAAGPFPEPFKTEPSKTGPRQGSASSPALLPPLTMLSAPRAA